MGLVGNQKKVIEYGKGNLLVEAGPGSGKTKVIVERIKELIKLGVDPESFLVITFTTKAADNLKFRLRKTLSNDVVLKMQISTIHSFCLEYLKSKDMSLTLLDDDTSEKKTLFIQKFKKELGFVNESTVLDYHFPAVLNKFGEYTCFNVDSNELIERIRDSRVITKEYLDFVNSLDYFSKKRIDDHDKPLLAERRKDPDFDDTRLYKNSWYNARYLQIARAYPIYLRLLDEYGYVDYDTLQLKALNELERDGNTQYKTIFVDEFQDTDPLQFRIFQILKANCDYFTAVGDVDQHIYAFRSSFNDFFDELIKLEGLDRLSLDVNFRSTENIVELTEAFIAPQREKTSQKHMKSNNVEYNNPNFLIENEDSEAEAENICQLIKDLTDCGVRESDIAVLYRKHGDATLPLLIEKLRCNGIGCSIKGRSDLSEMNVVKSVIAMLWYVSRKTNIGYIPSNDELDEMNLKAFCGEYFETPFWLLEDSTKSYLKELQDSYYAEVTRIENKLCGKEDKYKVEKVHRVKKRENQDRVIEIFEGLKMPEIDLDMIENHNDREFFKNLNEIRRKVNSHEPPTILNVFYQLVALSNLFGYEYDYSEIANLALLTQTISNYESFISETDFRGALFFLTRAIENYGSYQKDGDGVQLMTIHSAKGLEFRVTIITSLEKDNFPMKNKDPKHEMDYVYPNDTYYTPNDCLEFKKILKEKDGNLIHDYISLEEEENMNDKEENRVLYVAMTRAADLLVLSTIGKVPDQIEWIREYTIPYDKSELEDVTIKSEDEEPDTEPVVLNYSKYTQYISCPFKYDLGYNLGFRRSGMKAANLGTVFHEIMEMVNLKLIEGYEMSHEELSKITEEIYRSMFDIEENPNEYEKFKNNVIKYYDKYSKNREVLKAELDFEIYRGSYILNGAIDLIYKESENEIVILDYKYAEYDKDHIGGYTKQLYIYVSALRELEEYKDYTIKKAITHFVLNDRQHVVEIDEEVMGEEFSRLNEVAEEMGNGIFLKKPEKEGTCKRCQYRYFCKPKEFAGELYE